MKMTSSNWELKETWRCLLERSWVSSSKQSTVRQLQPQLTKALVRGALGPDIRSAIRGRPSCGSGVLDPEEAAASSSGESQRFPLQVDAPWLKAPQTRSFLSMCAQR